ncbi:MAG: hypothetical protein R3293_06090 [Candidatus Promineifilaceae bacterium]|nr:hypothetical protein [Candidatus Promineifilaceae bacterium]
MKLTTKRFAKYIAPIFVIALILFVVLLSTRQPSVQAGSPPPDVPDIEGEPFTVVLEADVQVPRENIEVNAIKSGWVRIFEEDFEGGITNPPWLNISVSGGPYIWGAEAIENPLDPSSTQVAWGVGTGVPELDPQVDGYPADVDAWLVPAGAFDFTEVVDAEMTFDLYLDAVPGVPGDPTKIGNTFAVAVSTDGSTYTGVQIIDGGSANWESLGQNLSDYAGEPQVWVALIFKSDMQPNPDNKLGALIDNVALDVLYQSKSLLPYVSYDFTPTPSPTPTATPTATPNPDQDYRDTFTDTIVPWEARRWTNNADFALQHRSDCDEGGRCGFLELDVKNNEKYVIVSPLVQSKSYPYNIEIEARLMPKSGSDYPRDQAQYGVIFGGNWNGAACPATDFSSCFTQYYELRVRFRSVNDKEFFEYKLKRIDGHDANNQSFGPDLIDWTKVDANPKKFVEWDINVSSDAKIRISMNNNHVGTAQDDKYLDNRYFGFEVRTGNQDGSRVKLDYFKID